MHRVHGRRLSIALLYAAQGSTCLVCHGYMSKRDASLEHVVPRSQGGADDWINMALSHLSCNRAKGSRMPTDEELDFHHKVICKLVRIIVPSKKRRRRLLGLAA